MTRIANDTSWWAQPTELVHESVMVNAKHLENLDGDRIARYEKYLRLYGGTKRLGVRPWEIAGPALESFSTTVDKLRLNVVKAAIDTVTAKVGKLRPRPTFVTTGGMWSDKKRAKDLQKFTDGAYHQSDVYQRAPEMFRDAMIFGTGALHVYSRNSKFACERVPIWELFVDRTEAHTGNPRNLWRIKYVGLDTLCQEFGDDEELLAKLESLETAPNDEDAEYGDTETSAKLVKIVECWYISTGRGAIAGPQNNEPNKNSEFSVSAVPAKGRHTIAVDGLTLVDEHYEHDNFPFTFFHWTSPVTGFWGISAVEDIIGIQVEINKLLQTVQRSMALVGRPWILTFNGNGVQPSKITNEVAQIFNVTGTQEPVVQTFQSVHPQVLSHLWELYAKAFEILGSNQLAASATAPPGLESGRALERLSEEHSERFMTASRAFEYAIGDHLAQHLIRVAKELDAVVPGGMKIKAPDGRVAIDLDWKSVVLDNDAFIIQVFQTSTLPTHPSARMAELERLQEAQVIDATEFRRLLDMPDLERSSDLAIAPILLIEKQLETMLWKEKPQIPLPFQDLDRALAMSQNELQLAILEGAPNSATRLLRDYITVCQALIEKRTQQELMQAQQAMQMSQQQVA